MHTLCTRHTHAIHTPATYFASESDCLVSQAACAVDNVSLMTKTIAYIVMPVVFVSLVSLAFGVVHVVTRVNAWRDRRQARRDSLAETPEHQYTAKLTAKLNVCIHGEGPLGHSAYRHCMFTARTLHVLSALHLHWRTTFMYFLNLSFLTITLTLTSTLPLTLTTAFMYFLNLSYMMLARRVLAIFDCKYLCQLPEYDDLGYISSCKEGHYYLEVDPRMHCYEYDLSPGADEFTKQWTRMALVSLVGVVLYVIGIPGLFFYKLFSNRAYTIFTKSLSMLSEQVYR